MAAARTEASAPGLAGQAALPDWLLHTPIAHRGLHDTRAGVPENSLAAFEAAVRAGYPIEMDVQLLADGRVAVFHDLSLRRMTGRRVHLAELTAGEIRPLRLQDSDQGIALLDEALELVAGRVGLLIETKNHSLSDRRLEQAVETALAGYDGPVAVQSFNPFSLQWFARNRPEIPRGQLAYDFHGQRMARYEKFLLRRLLMNWVSRPAFVSYQIRCLPFGAVARARRRGLAVLGWICRSRDQQRRAEAWCDNVIFEHYRPARNAHPPTAGGPMS